MKVFSARMILTDPDIQTEVDRILARCNCVPNHWAHVCDGKPVEVLERLGFDIDPNWITEPTEWLPLVPVEVTETEMAVARAAGLTILPPAMLRMMADDMRDIIDAEMKLFNQ